MKLLAYTKVKRKGAAKMFQTVFKRYEKKYIIDGGQYEEVKNYLTYNAVPDEYGKSRVCSLYYDTPDNRLIRASLDKPIDKEKLRLRARFHWCVFALPPAAQRKLSAFSRQWRQGLPAAWDI